jgi:lipopolysaccharide transport system permease protein
MNPASIVSGLWRHRQLISQLLRRDLTQRYRGSFLGILWSLLIPLSTLAIYTFVFAIVIKARWRPLAETTSSAEFALALFAGLVPFSVLAEVLTRAPGLVLAVPGYVKKVVFPLEVLPVVTLLSALVHSIFGLGILVLSSAMVLGHLTFSGLLLLPLVYVPLALLCLAAGWTLASLGVYIRDIGHGIGIAVQLLMFVCPVVYPAQVVPHRYQILLQVNPMTAIIETARQLVLWGQTPSMTPIAVWTAITAALAWLSYVWFMKTKQGFADVL